MPDYKRLLPKVYFGSFPDNAPSPHAFYHRNHRSIWVNTTQTRFAICFCFLHELVHHLIEVLDGRKETHDRYDRWWERRMMWTWRLNNKILFPKGGT